MTTVHKLEFVDVSPNQWDTSPRHRWSGRQQWAIKIWALPPSEPSGGRCPFSKARSDIPLQKGVHYFLHLKKEGELEGVNEWNRKGIISFKWYSFTKNGLILNKTVCLGVGIVCCAQTEEASSTKSAFSSPKPKMSNPLWAFVLRQMTMVN